VTGDGRKLIDRRHPEWAEHNLRWRWLLDSHEGGDRYREAIYGTDRRGLPLRNMIRHKREYPDPREVNPDSRGSTYVGGTATGLAGLMDSYASNQALPTDDDYELRRARTPVPSFVSEAVESYVAKVYGGEVRRDAPATPAFNGLREWWDDVDGLGTPADAWFKDVVAPLLLVLGQLDLCFDHPTAAPGVVKTRADQRRLRLDRCVVSYVLPENVLWWRLTEQRRYAEVLIREYADGGQCRFRHWTTETCTVLDDKGETVETHDNPFGVVPVIRIFDRRKPRCRNVGRSRMDAVAELQREYYNRDSELILSDTTQAHPLLQGPEDFVQADGTIPIGPSWLLPKKKNTQGGTATYEGFEVVDFPKGGAESIRQNLDRLSDQFYRLTKLSRPAGTSGTTAGSIGQSGVAKAFDHDDLHQVLASYAATLAEAEERAAAMALVVLTDGTPPEGEIEVSYPTAFALNAADAIAAITGDIQAALASAGEAPTTETALITEAVRKTLKGRPDAFYEAVEAEVAQAIARKASARVTDAEGTGGPLPMPQPPPTPEVDDDAGDMSED
jgi:hypothetical protein